MPATAENMMGFKGMAAFSSALNAPNMPAMAGQKSPGARSLLPRQGMPR
jgi:hypothetical protein